MSVARDVFVSGKKQKTPQIYNKNIIRISFPFPSNYLKHSNMSVNKDSLFHHLSFQV